MKVTHNAPTTAKFLPKNMQESKIDIKEHKKTPLDSLSISKNKQSLQIKEINQAIGSLQVTNKALQQLGIDAQNLLKDQDNPTIKKSIAQTLENSSFDGKNVFQKDYQKLSASIKTDFSSLRAQAQNLDNTANIKKFAQEIKLQQNQTKQAIGILHNQINHALQYQKGDYENLDTARLLNTNFKSAHDLGALSLDRVSKLLA